MAEQKKKTFSELMGIKKEVPQKRPAEETDIRLREDRVGRYFRKYLDRFVFAEFSDEYMEKSKVTDIMKGVPVPLRKQDIKKFAGGGGLEPNVIGENMAWVMGSDPKFKYTGKYVEYLKKLFNKKLDEGMLKEGRDAAEKEDWDNACIHFRAALCMNTEYLHAMYSYARVCRSMYLESEDPEYVGRFKAESLDWFELLTEIHPKFAQAYYYLGYAYLNIGLYAKTQAVWKKFVSISHNGKDRKEITKRLKQIKDPVAIEAACNDISSGRMERGIEELEPYLESRFNTWWPMHYYLGLAYKYTGRTDEAMERFRKALSLNGSHLESMKELLELYEERGDKANVLKYTNKIKLIEGRLEEEKDAEEKSKNRKALKKPAPIRKAKKKGRHEGQEHKRHEKTKAGIRRLD